MNDKLRLSAGLGEIAPTSNPEESKADLLARRIESVKKEIETTILDKLGDSSRYEEYPTDHALRRVKVMSSTTKKLEDGWFFVFGEGNNDEGNKAYAVGRFEGEDDFIGKAVTKEILDVWNRQEVEATPKKQREMGDAALQASGIEPPVFDGEVVDAPVEQQDAPGRFDQLLNPDFDDGLSDQERVAQAAVDPRSSEEKELDDWRRSAREADHKDSLAKQTARMQDGGN